jgi:hypothetical protein
MNEAKMARKLILRGLVVGLADAGGYCGREIRQTKGAARSSWRGTKKIIGEAARYTLLLVALLREIPYRVLEPRTRHPIVIERLARLVTTYGTRAERERWSVEGIRGWLALPEPTERLARRQAAEKRSVIEREARRAEIARRTRGLLAAGGAS